MSGTAAAAAGWPPIMAAEMSVTAGHFRTA
jgi:hypothetical protein